MSATTLKRVLFVDDDPNIRRFAEIALKRVGGLEVETCASGIEALEAAPRFRPDLILLDVMMPGMDGPSVLEALLKLSDLDEVAVVFVTAKVQPEEVQHYLHLGALGVIKKPFDPMKVSDQIREIWAQAKENTRPSADTDPVPEELQELAVDYRRSLLERLAWIEEQIASEDREFGDQELGDLRMTAHRLAGTGGIFGLPVVTEVCTEFQAVLDDVIDNQRSLDRASLLRLQGLCSGLRRTLRELEERPGESPTQSN